MCIWVIEATVILVYFIKLVAELLCDQISNGLHNVTADNSNIMHCIYKMPCKLSIEKGLQMHLDLMIFGSTVSILNFKYTCSSSSACPCVTSPRLDRAEVESESFSYSKFAFYMWSQESKWKIFATKMNSTGPHKTWT